MKKVLTKKKLILTIAGLLLLTFCVPASSHAAGVLLVPAAGLAVWGVTLVAAGVAAIFEGDNNEAEETRAQQEALKAPQVSDSDAGRGALELQPDEG
ncbi:MAG: hypothetical protein GY859_29460 [Desulfobacterales bacterium]|nr:hypothetical protein [Desulfobacterales bacterium]